MSPARYDLIVVGGGSAGCVVAARASEDPARRVLLIEAGPDPRPIPDVVADPKRQTELVLETDYVRMYDAERADGSTFPLLGGRIMGGGSSVNNLVVVRPMRADFDAWTGFGGETWSYEALLPLMRAIETDPDFADSPIHGDHGPLRLHRGYRLEDEADPPVVALIEAAHAFGLPSCPDLNVPEPFGICASPYNQVDGRRQSTVAAWLDPARDRPNLEIRADTTVTRLILDGSRVIGVEVDDGAGGAEVIEAAEVVVAAGAFETPHLLLLSGIGAAEALEPHGIAVRHRLDGVGANYQDHAVVYITFEGTVDLHEDFVIPKVRLIAKSRPELTTPDLHVFMRPSIRMPGVAPMLPVSLHLLQQRSRGRVSLASADPADPPRVQTGLLEDARDVEAMLDGMDFVDRLTKHPALARFYGEMVTPASRADWREHILTAYDTYHHAVGTCRIGPAGDPLAVVDPELRVHGLDGLRIADASVLPVIPHANTNLAAILVGEIAARAIVAGASQALATADG
ncbi:MAG TPA: GMC family oxidoreductase N-terminal domain-containing protein [Candidatus Limnocylindrales bacterium]|nr:GMC family oxidoreductase N-terminal domain-containing protein [Candidatus Limnocylindrales bacterium]